MSASPNCVLLLALLVNVVAQTPPGPPLRKAAAPEIVIVTATTDVDCRLVIDGRPAGDLRVGEPVKLRMSRRAHTLEAISAGQDRWTVGIDLTKSKPSAAPMLTIQLKAVVEKRIKGERKAVLCADYDDLSNLAFSPDGKHVAVAAKSGTTWRVLVDGSQYPPDSHSPDVAYSEVSTLYFSADGDRLAYRAKTGARQYQVVIGGKKVGPTLEDVYSFRNPFSPDGKHSAFAGELNGKWHIFLDGEPGAEFEDIPQGFVGFTADSRLIYVGRRDGVSRVYVDNQPGPGYPSIASVKISGTGSHVAYVGSTGKSNHVVVDGQITTEAIDVGDVCLSEDGKSVGYLALIEKGGFTFSASNGNLSPGETLPSKWALVRNGESVVNGAYLEVRNVSWASDCKHAWYGAATGPYKVERAIDGELMGLFPFSTDPAIGGGGRIAYARLEDRNRWYLVVDGKRVGEFESVASLQFSPDGSQLAVLAKKPNEPRHLYVNNQVRSEFEAAADLIQYAAKIMFSPDGKHLVVHALGALFVDGKRIPEAVSPKTVPVVSPDSRQVVFSAVSPGGKHHLVFYPLKVVPGG